MAESEGLRSGEDSGILPPPPPHHKTRSGTSPTSSPQKTHIFEYSESIQYFVNTVMNGKPTTTSSSTTTTTIDDGEGEDGVERRSSPVVSPKAGFIKHPSQFDLSSFGFCFSRQI